MEFWTWNLLAILINNWRENPFTLEISIQNFCQPSCDQEKKIYFFDEKIYFCGIISIVEILTFQRESKKPKKKKKSFQGWNSAQCTHLLYKIKDIVFLSFFKYKFIYFNWKLIIILYWFCHTLTWICRGYTCVPVDNNACFL